MTHINPEKEELRREVLEFVTAGLPPVFCREISVALGRDPRDVAEALNVLRRRKALDWDMVGAHYCYKRNGN